jgi:hypothetical protein
VNAQVKALGTDGLPLMLSNEESALLRISQDDREQSFFNDARNQKNQINSENINEIPLVACITGRASFPTLSVEDIRLDITNTHALVQDVEQLWRQFSLSELNYDLSVPLTPEEIALNSKSSPAIEDFKRYEFQFTPQVLPCYYSLTHLLTRSLTYSLTHSLILTYSPTHVLTYSLTYLLTHSGNRIPNPNNLLASKK